METVVVPQDVHAREVRLGTAARAMDGVARQRVFVEQGASPDLGPAAR